MSDIFEMSKEEKEYWKKHKPKVISKKEREEAGRKMQQLYARWKREDELKWHRQLNQHLNRENMIDHYTQTLIREMDKEGLTEILNNPLEIEIAKESIINLASLYAVQKRTIKSWLLSAQIRVSKMCEEA